MREPVEDRARLQRLGRNAGEGAAELLFHRGQELVEAPGVEHVFQPRLVAVGAVAVLDEDADDGVGDRGRFGGLHDHAGVAREILVAGDAAERQLEPDAGFDAEAVLHHDGLEADIVGVLQHRDPAGAVEGDVELARQAVERAIVEDVMMPFARIGPGVEQFLRIDAGGRRAGDVADIVGAGAARAETEILDRLDHVGGVLRLDLAQLQVGARGHMRIGAGIFLRDIGKARELPVRQDAVRNAQAAHIGGLRRRDIEQAEIAPAEIVGGLRRLVLLRLLAQLRIGIERMQLALEFLLVGELAAGRDRAVLRLDVDGVGPDRLALAAPPVPLGDARGREAGHEAFEIALLVGGEIAGHVRPPALSRSALALGERAPEGEFVAERARSARRSGSGRDTRGRRRYRRTAPRRPGDRSRSRASCRCRGRDRGAAICSVPGAPRKSPAENTLTPETFRLVAGMLPA